MVRASGLLSALLDVFRPASSRRSTPTPRRSQKAPPSQAGSGQTVEVDPRSLGPVRLEWAPSADGLPDPGEIVWTWVPYEENDGRGKDRPVLIVSAGRSGLLGVQLTSKDHDGDPDHVSIGTGAWDSAHRESWARLDRLFRVDASSVRREAAFLPEKTYRRAAKTLASRYGWTVV